MSGFLRHDYILTFDVSNVTQREALRAWCRNELAGEGPRLHGAHIEPGT